MRTQQTTTNISVPSLLGITFVVLKLCGVIDWSWWYVTMPFWVMLALFFIVLFFVALADMLSNRRQQ